MGNLIKESKRRLHAQGGRMTAQRKLILQTLESLGGHPTADDLFEVVQQQDSSVHLSTVYRTLRWLEEEGLVSARWFDEERRQERFDPVQPSDHHHFQCTSCKRVIEFDNLLVDTIKAQFELHSGAFIETASIMLYGLCADCREKQNQLSFEGKGELSLM